MAIQMPKNMSIEEKSGELTIIRRWFSLMFIFMSFFVLFWNTIVIAYYIGIFYSIFQKGEGLVITHEEALTLCVPLLHLLLGLGFLYYTICGFFNKTQILITFEQICVTHGPIPWFGNRTIAIHDIQQLFCKEHKGSKGALSYSVNVSTKEGKKVKIVSGLTDSIQARFIEETIEKRLNIKDETIAGEYK